MHKTKSGFTIVELLIVIVVIGILAAITIVAYNGIQGRARDTERTADIAQLHKALELFYAENNYYPAVSDVRDTSFRANQLKVSESIVTPPSSATTISYCWSSGPGAYCYVGRASSGGSFDCTAAGERCIGYTLSYRLDSAPDVRIDKRSLIWL